MGGGVVLKILHMGDTESWDQLLVDKGRRGGPQTWINKKGETQSFKSFFSYYGHCDL